VSEIPIACTLTSDEMVDRGTEWSAMIRRATARAATDDGVRLTFPRASTIAAELADLCAREVECCAFFVFTISITSEFVTLEVTAPAEARELVTALIASA
jgi:hypothetical protein